MARTHATRAAQTISRDLDFMRLLWRIEHGLQSTSKRMETRLGITGPQRLVLKIVDFSPGVTARELSQLVRLHPSTLTGILRRLEHKRLIRRTPNPADSRWRHLHATTAARRFTRRSGGTIESAIEDALAEVSADQIAAARVVLTAVAEALEATSSLPDPDEHPRPFQSGLLPVMSASTSPKAAKGNR